MIGVIAAYTNRKVTAADIDEYRKQHPEATDTDAEIKDVLVDDGCSEDYRRMFGQRSRREHWNNVHDLTEKDQLPVEKAFRAARKLPEDKVLRPRVTPAQTTLAKSLAQSKANP